MTKVTVSVRGLADLDAALADLVQMTSSSTGKNALRAAGRAALKPFDDAWRQKAPHLTGALEESGGVGSKLSRSQRQQVERESTVEVFAGPGPLPQAVQQEFGNRYDPAQPFVRPAWDETQGQVLGGFKGQLAAQIDKKTERARRKAAKLTGG